MSHGQRTARKKNAMEIAKLQNKAKAKIPFIHSHSSLLLLFNRFSINYLSLNKNIIQSKWYVLQGVAIVDLFLWRASLFTFPCNSWVIKSIDREARQKVVLLVLFGNKTIGSVCVNCVLPRISFTWWEAWYPFQKRNIISNKTVVVIHLHHGEIKKNQPDPSKNLAVVSGVCLCYDFPVHLT